MMQGTVDDNFEAWITLTIYSRAGQSYFFSALVDTGCFFDVTLPADMVQLLGLLYDQEADVRTGTGKIETARAYFGTVSWNGNPQEVSIIATGEEPVIGIGLMREHHLSIDIRPGGIVRIEQQNVDMS